MAVLQGIRVIELAGLAPVPYCAMLLADFGADVVRVDRSPTGTMSSRADDPFGRGKRSLGLNLKDPRGRELLLSLLKTADVLLDPYRPGTLERLGLGPEGVCERNAGLIYARLTGYGQKGPLCQKAGHDINYIAVGGALGISGRAGQGPVPPANLLADFAGGGLLCAFGVVLALLERSRSGQGQVIDSAMVEGVASLTTMLQYMHQVGLWQTKRGTNWFDSGAPWYDAYETEDGKYMAVGALEPPFFAALLQGLGLKASEVGEQMDPSAWPKMHQLFQSRFLQKTQAQWVEVFEPLDACVTPVLALDELERHPQHRARNSFFRSEQGITQPGAFPLLQRTPGQPGRFSPRSGQHTGQILAGLGIERKELQLLSAERVVWGDL